MCVNGGVGCVGVRGGGGGGVGCVGVRGGGGGDCNFVSVVRDELLGSC